MKPLISIITINYNNKEGLLKTFESVFNQTYKHFEYIVIDGGSTDGSKELIEENKDKITFWESKPDKGIYNAMNNGILASKGKYLNFMNSGDTFHDQSVLLKSIEYLYNDIMILYGDVSFNSNSFKDRKYPDKIDLNYLFFKTINHQSCFLNSKIFNECFLYNEKLKIVSDWELMIYSIVIKNHSSFHLPFFVAKYDLTGLSMNEILVNSEREYVLKKHFNYLYNNFMELKKLRDITNQNFYYINKKNKKTMIRKIQTFLFIIMKMLSKI